MSILDINPFEALGELIHSGNTEAPVQNTELAPEAKEVWYDVRVTGGKAELKLANVILLTDAEFLAPQVTTGEPAMPTEQSQRVTSFATVQTSTPVETKPVVTPVETPVAEAAQAPAEITPEVTPEVIPAKTQANTNAPLSVDAARANLAELFTEAA